VVGGDFDHVRFDPDAGLSERRAVGSEKIVGSRQPRAR
jgi:hypothetical protein